MDTLLCSQIPWIGNFKRLWQEWYVCSMMSRALAGWLRVTPCWELEYLRLEDLLPRWFYQSCVWNLCWDDYKTELSQDSKLNHLYMTSPCGLCFSHSLRLNSEKEFPKSELLRKPCGKLPSVALDYLASEITQYTAVPRWSRQSHEPTQI